MAVGDDDCKQMRKKSQFTYVHLSLSFCFSNITHNCWPRKKIIFTFDIISITQIGKFTTTKQKKMLVFIMASTTTTTTTTSIMMMMMILEYVIKKKYLNEKIAVFSVVVIRYD